MSVTKPMLLDETYQDKMDELKTALVGAIGGISLGNYVVVNINNYTWGSVSGGGVYPAGTPVTLRATPKTGCFFLAWRNADGAILSINSEYTFTPASNTVIQADFNADEYVKIVSWANGTDVDITAMLSAHYRGVIDIHDYWSVGDTRTVHLEAMSNYIGATQIVPEAHAAQDTEWVLMDTTLTGITSADANYSSLAFAVGMKDCLNEPEGNYWGFGNRLILPMRDRGTWLRDIFAPAVPSVFRGWFKDINLKFYGKLTAEDASDSLHNYVCKFSLFPAGTVWTASELQKITFPASENANYSRFEWYEAAGTTFKKRNGSNARWLTGTIADGNRSSTGGSLLASWDSTGLPKSDWAYNAAFAMFGCI